MIYVWAMTSGVLVVGCEITFKLSESYWSRAWAFVPLAVLINYSIFRLVHEAPNLPAAFVVFSLATLGLRTGASIWLQHPIGVGTWIAIVLLTLGAIARQVWK